MHDSLSQVDPFALTRQLIEIESPTFHENAVGKFLVETLTALGYAVETMPVPQPDPALVPGAGTLPRFNVYAVPPETNPEIVFSTHMDTVPPHVPFREDDDFLYGRGACDAKGIIAAQICASQQLLAQDIPTGLLFLVGEERDSAGAKVANRKPRGSRYLINGEPTDSRLALASKGSLRVDLRAHGKMAHSAYPELGESAIAKLVEVLHDIQQLELPVEETIGPSTLNIGLIAGGRAPNVVPDEAEAHLLIRLVGPAEAMKQLIESTVASRVDISYSFEVPLVRMRALGDIPTMIANFTTDIPSLTAWGEPFLLGPGSIHVAHTPNERISRQELLDCIELYVRLAGMLAAIA
ncbi:M20/M25/M40 family metallo-hydrolase [Terriglobus tenax]|uniref:M20/M25/M40 family metallo-hydrolase n=1 Tax=Terriglobus tenax TaxID=1111115 RepID=UPI0021DFC89E|nr:M20/M25/M40 family metallo-hydrolase [Terriglobus tenax]